MIDQLPAPQRKSNLAIKREPMVVPILIADEGEQASWRYVEFFTANIRNANTRRAYARACSSFLAWCEERGPAVTKERAHRRAAKMIRELRSLGYRVEPA